MKSKDEGGRMKDERSRGTRAIALRCAFILLPSSLVLGIAGCNVVGAVISKTAPPPLIRAQYAPAKEPTLILVENFNNPAALRLESDAIARHLAGEFTLHKVSPVVDPSGAAKIRQQKGAAYRHMPLDAIGQAVGARQVVYVDLQRFEIRNAIASDLLSGQAEARVRVVDDTGALLWPIDSAGGYPVNVKVEPDRNTPGAGDHLIRNRLHAKLADRVAKLFYDWRSEDADGAEQTF